MSAFVKKDKFRWRGVENSAGSFYPELQTSSRYPRHEINFFKGSDDIK